MISHHSSRLGRLRGGLLLGLLLGLGTLRVAAQTTSTATPTMSAVLTDIISLNATISTAQLVFDNAAKYNNGTSTTVTNQFNITSNKAYTLTVRASGDLSNGQATPITIPVSSVSLAANWALGLTGSIAALSTTAQALTSSGPATQQQNISTTYTVSAANAANFLRPAGTYTTTLTFTATQN